VERAIRQASGGQVSSGRMPSGPPDRSAFSMSGGTMSLLQLQVRRDNWAARPWEWQVPDLAVMRARVTGLSVWAVDL
jgi:hypothetical protein